jgi:hypothetical protein
MRRQRASFGVSVSRLLCCCGRVAGGATISAIVNVLFCGIPAVDKMSGNVAFWPEVVKYTYSVRGLFHLGMTGSAAI